MSDFGLIKTLLRELSAHSMQVRGPRPSASIAVERVIEALRTGGSANGRFASGYVFHTANITQTIAGALNCIDLGAAPGCQLLQLAILNPEIEFIGVDSNPDLLAVGAEQASAIGANNVSWRLDDICTLDRFETNSADAIISTMSLHDLADLNAVERCLQASRRVLKPEGALYLEDYGRLKSSKSIEYFNLIDSKIPDDAFAELNACSMHAAFQIAELKPLFAKYFPEATLCSTFLIPFLNVLKTTRRDLSQEKLAKIRLMRTSLSEKQKSDLADLKKFFRLGGWVTDILG